MLKKTCACRQLIAFMIMMLSSLAYAQEYVTQPADWSVSTTLSDGSGLANVFFPMQIGVSNGRPTVKLAPGRVVQVTHSGNLRAEPVDGPICGPLDSNGNAICQQKIRYTVINSKKLGRKVGGSYLGFSAELGVEEEPKSEWVTYVGFSFAKYGNCNFTPGIQIFMTGAGSLPIGTVPAKCSNPNILESKFCGNYNDPRNGALLANKLGSRTAHQRTYFVWGTGKTYTNSCPLVNNSCDIYPNYGVDNPHDHNYTPRYPFVSKRVEAWDYCEISAQNFAYDPTTGRYTKPAGVTGYGSCSCSKLVR
jgi:hypothetical protein